MNILFILITVIAFGMWAFAFFICRENGELKDRVSVLLTDRCESNIRLLTIAHDTSSLIEDIEKDSGNGSYYISSPQYLLSRLENIRAATGSPSLAAPITPLGTTAAEDGGGLGTTFPAVEKDQAKGSAE